MAKKMHDTPNLDQLESGPWPSFVTGLKRLAKDNDMAVDLLGQLELPTRRARVTGRAARSAYTVMAAASSRASPRSRTITASRVYKDAAEFHTLRVMPPAGMHYTTEVLRKHVRHLGKTRLRPDRLPRPVRRHHVPGRDHARTCRRPSTRSTRPGFDLGGAGPAVRTSMSCVGAARCEQSCYDEAKAHRTVLNTFLDDIHRPALPYKFKFKFSGCPNDCMNSIQRSDMAVIGTWRDNIRTDEATGEEMVRQARHGRTGQRRGGALPDQDVPAQGNQGHQARATASPASP